MDQSTDCRNQKPESVLQGDGYWMNKILARESSVGQSSRIYYRGTNEGVPFKWEMEPGTPKGQPAEEVIPPPTLPPAVQNLGLPKPSLTHHAKDSRRARFWFWIMGSMRRKENQKPNYLGGKHKRNVTSSGDRAISSDEFEGFYHDQFGDSDGEFTASANDSRSSSSASSASSNGISLGVQRLRGSVPLFCGPWQQ